MMRKAALLSTLIILPGCGVSMGEISSTINKNPALSPVGSGLNPPTVPINADPVPRPRYGPGNSLWQDTSADLFRDPRASRVGDVITVKIAIRDRAQFDNRNERSREQEGELDVSFDYGVNIVTNGVQGSNATGTGNFSPKVNSTTDTKSEGKINRSETIQLLVAAVVTDVLPNGNLMIAGTQEVRVNYELRLLGVAGVVRPRDIATDNSISYDKIAEARISYGGRGRITEISQPAWGQQLLDRISPF
jgi:flagellar L-ring protein precursor FlgH